MNAYLIDSSKLKAVARFPSEKDAEQAGKASTLKDFDIICDVGDALERYRGRLLVDLFNANVAADRRISKFPTRTKGIERILRAFEALDLPRAFPNKKARTPGNTKRRGRTADEGYAPKEGTKFARAIELLIAGKSREQIAKIITKEFPNLRNTGPKFVTWARSQGRRKGLLPTEGTTA